MFKVSATYSGNITNDLVLDGYIMPTKDGFSIDGEAIDDINIVSKKLSKPLVSHLVNNKFNRLIDKLTDLFISDDDGDGSSYREVLDRIEKFRLIVKNRYREYLTQKELEKMSKKLKLLQKEALTKLLSLNNVNVVGKNNYRGK